MESLDWKFDFRDKRNLSLLMDFYELTMSQTYFDLKKQSQVVTFDMYYRKNPDNGGYAIFAGLEEVIGYIQNLCFSQEDIEYLRTLNKFSEEFLHYLLHFIFTGDIYAIKEGTPIFPHEPLIRVKAPIIEAQLIETALLLCCNHQTLIATKASRIVRAAGGREVIELGARRAHNFDAAKFGARACYIGGVSATATTLAGKEFGIPVTGTMAHSFVQSFEHEYDAFLSFAKTYPESCTLLLDTYHTLQSGAPNAIKVAKEYLEPNGYRLGSVRIDSGDISYLSKQLRVMLDEAGMSDCKIVASNSLDEYIISSLISQGAEIDIFGVGENLIVSKSTPVFGGVYKLTSVEEDGEFVPRIKVSENVGKVTNPGFKNLYRIYDIQTGKAVADYMTLHDEVINPNEDLTIYHQFNVWENKVIKGGTYQVRDLLEPVFINGKLVMDVPTLDEIVAYSKEEFNHLWEEYLRFEYPQTYFVDLSKKLLDLKLSLLEGVNND